MYLNIYVYICMLTNDSAGAYQHYSSCKKEGPDYYGKKESTIETFPLYNALNGYQSEPAESSSSAEGGDKVEALLFVRLVSIRLKWCTPSTGSRRSFRLELNVHNRLPFLVRFVLRYMSLCV